MRARDGETENPPSEAGLLSSPGTNRGSGLLPRLMAGALAAAGPRWRCGWRRAAGFALAAGFVWALLGLWHPVYRFSGLLQVGRDFAERALPVVRQQPVLVHAGGYDGQFYAQLACDPTLRSPGLTAAIDSLAYRSRRILLPATAWGLGLGQPGRAFQIYPWLNIVGWFALALVLWPLLQADHRWAGVAAWAGVLFSAGALQSVRYALTDLPALLLVALAMRAAQAARPGRMAAWWAAGLLTRETVVVGAWGLWPGRGVPRGSDRRAVAAILAALIPLAGWLLYVQWRVGTNSAGIGGFAWPGVGLVGDWLEEVRYLWRGGNRLWGVTSLAATLAVTAQAVFLLVCWKSQDRWWRAGAGTAVLLLVLGPAVWEGLFGAALRVLLPLQLACNVLLLTHRRSAWWLLLLNLSVPAGLVEVTPWSDPAELAAVRRNGSAAVLRAADGCFAPERSSKDRWVWTAADARMELRLWSETDAVHVGTVFRVRALDERDLVVSWAGGELWRGRVGRAWTEVRLPVVTTEPGMIVLNLHSDSPAIPADPGRDSRLLSVCVLEPELEFQPAARKTD